MPPVISTDHWIDHPEGRVFAREWSPPTATGAPILMLHDSLGCVELWREFPQALCRRSARRVIAYDRLGFGRSDPRVQVPPQDFIAEEAARYVPVLCRQLGLERMVVLGHSVGGAMAIQLAAQAPQVCQALITIAAQVFIEERTLEGIRRAKEQFKDVAQFERLTKYHGAKTAWVLGAWTERWLDPAFRDWTLEPVLPQVECPVLAIHGALDEYGSTEHAATIGRLSPGPTKVHIVPGAGHLPHRERPGLVEELVCALLAQAAPG